MRSTFYWVGKLRTMVLPSGHLKLMRTILPYLGYYGMDSMRIFLSSDYSSSCL